MLSFSLLGVIEWIVAIATAGALWPTAQFLPFAATVSTAASLLASTLAFWNSSITVDCLVSSCNGLGAVVPNAKSPKLGSRNQWLQFRMTNDQIVRLLLILISGTEPRVVLSSSDDA